MDNKEDFFNAFNKRVDDDAMPTVNDIDILYSDRVVYTTVWFRNNKHNFEDWFDASKFNWDMGSWLLAIILPNKFDIWFSKETYNYDSARYLMNYCPNYIHKWYDKSLLYRGYSFIEDLINNTFSQCDVWLDDIKDYLVDAEDTERFNIYINLLTRVPDKVSVWYNRDHMTNEIMEFFPTYALEYRSIWESDYILFDI